MNNDKLHLEAVDKPGAPNRRWQCRYCLKIGTLTELAKLACPAGASHPPLAAS